MIGQSCKVKSIPLCYCYHTFWWPWFTLSVKSYTNRADLKAILSIKTMSMTH